MRSFLRFHRGLLGMPLHWQLWLGLLISANLIAPFSLGTTVRTSLQGCPATRGGSGVALELAPGFKADTPGKG